MCTYALLSAQDSAAADDNAAQGWGPAKGAGPGGWYRRVCVVDAQGDTSATVVWLAQPPGGAAVDPVALARQALGHTPIGAPGVHLNPPADRDQIVSVTTWLWVDPAAWAPASANASAGGVTVTTTATPAQLVWSMGDGHSVTCAGPGTPYDPTRPDVLPSCAYTYLRSSAGQPGGAFTITATESWQVSWTGTGVPAGAPAGGSLGVVTRTSALAARVAESQAINTGG